MVGDVAGEEEFGEVGPFGFHVLIALPAAQSLGRYASAGKPVCIQVSIGNRQLRSLATRGDGLAASGCVEGREVSTWVGPISTAAYLEKILGG